MSKLICWELDTRGKEVNIFYGDIFFVLDDCLALLWLFEKWSCEKILPCLLRMYDYYLTEKVQNFLELKIL